MMMLRVHLRSIRACADAIEWAGKRRSIPRAWAECPRGDWLLWYAATVGVDRRLIVLAACACARLSLVHVPQGEDRPRLAIEAAEAWARGEVSIDAVVRATAAAQSCGDNAAYAAAAAAYAAAYSTYAADADADANVTAADTAYATLARCADIVRSIIPTPTDAA